MFKKENRVETILALCFAVTLGILCVLVISAFPIIEPIHVRIALGCIMAVIIFWHW